MHEAGSNQSRMKYPHPALERVRGEHALRLFSDLDDEYT